MPDDAPVTSAVEPSAGGGRAMSAAYRRMLRAMAWQPELEELRRREELARRMGGEERVARQHATGRLTVRERIERLFDPGSFHETGAIAGAARYEDGELADFVPANTVVGHGPIEGRRAGGGDPLLDDRGRDSAAVRGRPARRGRGDGGGARQGGARRRAGADTGGRRRQRGRGRGRRARPAEALPLLPAAERLGRAARRELERPARPPRGGARLDRAARPAQAVPGAADPRGGLRSRLAVRARRALRPSARRLARAARRPAGGSARLRPEPLRGRPDRRRV